jgi:hypothetical protein
MSSLESAGGLFLVWLVLAFLLPFVWILERQQ